MSDIDTPEVRPIETIAAFAAITIVLLYILFWLGSYLSERGFVSSCTSDGGTAMFTDEGKRCFHGKADLRLPRE